VARDKKIEKELKLRSWEPKKVRSFVVCYNCGKRRCIYSPSDAVYIGAITALQQKLESVSDRFSCGDLIFEDDDPLSKAVVQKKNLTCETRIERGYYNHRERALKLRALCVHCGEHGPTGTFLLDQNELEARCLTGGYKCFPICVECLDEGKKVVKNGSTKNAIKAREEKERLIARNRNS